jgi:hypothetical protein
MFSQQLSLTLQFFISTDLSLGVMNPRRWEVAQSPTPFATLITFVPSYRKHRSRCFGIMRGHDLFF